MAASPSSSSSPSSSAVTLPRPGKSILKKPPPPQQPFFSLSRLSRLIPTPLPSPSSSAPGPIPTGTPITSPSANSEGAADETLKRAHFYLPHLATVYPFSASNPPCSTNQKEEKKLVETREAERRKRIVRGNSFGPGSPEAEEWWSPEKVELFYRECCEGREEKPHPGISAALKRVSGGKGRSLDLSGVQLSLGQAVTLSDVFAVEWGLRKLYMKECDLDERNLKPILHSLLIPRTLSFLSVASNRKLKTSAFRLIGAFLKKSKNLQFLDLSQNILDKKSVEYIGGALAPANQSGLVSLRVDDCSLRPAALEALAQAVRTSSLRNISLRHNRISSSGAVALALMIKDYPDAMGTYNPASSSVSSSPTSTSSTLFNSLSPPHTPNSLSPPDTPTRPNIHLPPPRPQTQANVLPPPPHPSQVVQTTYTPYIPRSRRIAPAKAIQQAALAPNPLSATGQQVPIITSSAQGGITTRHPVPPPLGSAGHGPSHGVPNAGSLSSNHRNHGPSAALLDKVRALDALPRLGELRTLDLRGNDIKNGITYIAQVLKRNRTLKVLNLSENKLDVQGLVAIAEALKYNLTLDTLDLSKNPCSGPSLEGIQSLRTAFTLNTSLKRLFLSSTSMTSTGAIALAEFLPESTSLLHLDLTLNNLDLAGVMALSGGLKANHTMRCLDLNIPPDDEEFARMCRDILNTCVRNTEEAEKVAQAAGNARSVGKGVWGLIEDSALAKRFRQDEGKKVDGDVVAQAKECQSRLQEQLSRLSPNITETVDKNPTKRKQELLDHAKAINMALADAIEESTDPVQLEELLLLNDSITWLMAEVEKAGQQSGGSSAITSPATPESDQSGTPETQSKVTDVVPLASAKLNGLKLHIPSAERAFADEVTEEALSPGTPKVDKGKGRAGPEPEILEKVLSPGFVIAGEEYEFDGKIVNEPEEIARGPSPVALKKSLLQEEGEVFRKSNALLGPEEIESEYDTEELRIELLETEVERPPPRSLNTDEFGQELPPLPNSPAAKDVVDPMAQDPAKPSPRPYLRRSRSSSSSTLQGTSSPNLEKSPQRIGENGKASPLTPSPETSVPSTPLSPCASLPGAVPYVARVRSSSSSANSVDSH